MNTVFSLQFSIYESNMKFKFCQKINNKTSSTVTFNHISSTYCKGWGSLLQIQASGRTCYSMEHHYCGNNDKHFPLFHHMSLVVRNSAYIVNAVHYIIITQKSRYQILNTKWKLHSLFFFSLLFLPCQNCLKELMQSKQLDPAELEWLQTQFVYTSDNNDYALLQLQRVDKIWQAILTIFWVDISLYGTCNSFSWTV